MGYVFATETFERVIHDIKPLLERHWQEIAVYPDIPLDPDYEIYKKLCDLGICEIYTARQDGKLVGYAIYMFRRSHPHYARHGWANSDIVMVMPEHRNARVATGLYDLIESDMGAKGIHVIHTTTKTEHPELAQFLRARGHARVEEGFSKRLN